MKQISAYDLGRTAYAVGRLNLTNDVRLMEMMIGKTREEKRKMMADWKQGRRDAKEEAEAPKKKKKTSKKKSNK